MIYLISFFGLSPRAGLRAIEHTRPIFLAYLWATFFSLVILMVDFLGLSGAVAGLLVSNLVLVAVLSFGLRKRLARNSIAPKTAGKGG